MNGVVDMIGRRCGLLVARERATGRPGDHRAFWRCDCDCGGSTVACGAELRNGHTQSCGCIHDRRGFFVGGARPPEYDVWKAMRSRCNSPKNKVYRHYGGRGITVCDRWSKFGNFMDDMGPRPTPTHQIERKDNSLGYSPDNCVWATRAEQMVNTRRFRRVLIDGQLTTILEYAARTGVSYRTASARLRRIGAAA